MRYIIKSIMLCVFTLPVLAASSYELPITRDGKTITRIAYNDWLGEYPAPVINVSVNKSGYTKIKAFRSLRKLNQPVVCHIKNGLYHPWSKTGNSVDNYYSILPLQRYRARRNTKLEDKQIKSGAVISRVHFLSEGYCAGVIGKKSIDFLCDDLEDGAFKKLTPEDDFSEQWLYVSCREGYKAFVKDDVLLAQKGVQAGKVIKYGSVSP